MAIAIDEHFTEGEAAAKFENLHGTFTGIMVLVLSVIPMIPLRLILEANLLTEFQAQMMGLFICTAGLMLCAVSLRFKLLWLTYVSTLPTGIGSLCIFQRLVFSHQLWFKRIGKSNLGSGIFGFGIGIWTAFFFLVTIAFLEIVDVEKLFYIYAGFLFICVAYPLCTIDDDKLKRISLETAVTEEEEEIERSGIELAENEDGRNSGWDPSRYE